MIAEYERAQILERSRRGKRHRAHSGEVSVMSGAPYGYCYIRKTDEAPAAYTVVEAEARVVQAIYEMYTVEASASVRSPAGSTPMAFRLGKRVPGGNARLSGPCCATLHIVASHVSARHALLHEHALSVHCAGEV